MDDDNESRVKLVFEPYQAIRMVTADCFDLPDSTAIIPQTIMEIENSSWVSELSRVLKKTDHEADFLDNAKHFLLPLQDEFLEIVAWRVHFN